LVLDTNVIVEDWLLGSPAATHIRNLSAYGPVTLLVPDLVIREAVGVYRRRLKSAQRDLNRAVAQRRKLEVGARDPLLEQLDTSVDLDSAAIAYDLRLREVLDRAHATILPLPNVGHDRLVERALLGRKPFDQDGHNGYRDALIWHSVLEGAVAHDKTILVTANCSDFADSRDNPEQLATELTVDVEALRSREARPIEVKLRRDFAAVIEKEFPVHHAVVLDLRQRLQTDRQFFRSVYDQLNDVNNQLYADVDLDPDIDLEWDDVDLEFINDLHDFDVVGVAPGNAADPSFLRIIAHADVQYQVEVSAWSAFDERGLPVRQDIDWNERTEKGRLTDVLPAELEFQALYVPGDSKLSDVELMTIRENWDWVVEGRTLGGPVERPERLS
jgi:predicted nucleic acid-binding protein